MSWPDKLLAAEMGFCGRSVTKSTKQDVRNVNIRETVGVGNKMLEIREEKLLGKLGHVELMAGSRLPRRILE